MIHGKKTDGTLRLPLPSNKEDAKRHDKLRALGWIIIYVEKNPPHTLKDER